MGEGGREGGSTNWGHFELKSTIDANQRCKRWPCSTYISTDLTIDVKHVSVSPTMEMGPHKDREKL